MCGIKYLLLDALGLFLLSARSAGPAAGADAVLGPWECIKYFGCVGSMLFDALGLFLLSVHVSSQVAGADLHVWPGVLACGVVSVARRTWSSWSSGLADLAAPATHQLVAGGFAAWCAGTFAVYARAFAALPLVLFWLEVAARRGALGYDPSTSRFLLTRANAYALVRALGALAQVRADVPARLVRLLPLAVASAETLGMRVLGHGGSYAFAVDSPTFASYALLKSGAFVALPYLEDALATPPGWIA